MVHLLKNLLLFLCLHARACTAKSVTYSRGDKEAYLTARGDTKHGESAPKNLKDLRTQLKNDPTPTPEYTYDDPQHCTIYLAESSIPNAGLGLYSTIPLARDTPIGHDEVGILMPDMWHHYPNADLSKDLYKNYVWGDYNLQAGIFEAKKSSAMIPGMGMMVNDHPGLSNVIQNKHSILTRFWEDGDDTTSVEGGKHDNLEDAGRGAYASHSSLRYHTARDIEAGDEIFVSYGTGWFAAREHLYGPVPEAEHYKAAHDTLTQFMNRAGQDGLEITSLGMQQRYDERIYKAEWLKERPKVKAALPENVSDIPEVLRMGAAAFSMKDNKRTVEWIEENGMCMDVLVPAKSTIPQAGKGAFASRAIPKDANILTTPVITMTLDQLTLREVVTGSDWDEYVIHGGFQQLLNYCYGHEDSTLVFFPAAPVVNFVNHGSKEEANAEIRWSATPYHKAEWLDAPLDEMKTKTKSGLFFDIVATKPIARGDEILLYYGDSWEKSWDYQVKNFNADGNFTDMLGVPTAQDYNTKDAKPVQTVFEQKTSPYPTNIDTACFFVAPEDCDAPTDESKGVRCELRSNYSAKNHQQNLYHCDILSRYDGEDGLHWYTANVTVTKPKQTKNKDGQGKGSKAQKARKAPAEITEYYLVEYLPRYAIRFVDKPYTKDQFRRGGFRHPIGIGEGMMPEDWLDLRKRVD